LELTDDAVSESGTFFLHPTLTPSPDCKTLHLWYKPFYLPFFDCCLHQIWKLSLYFPKDLKPVSENTKKPKVFVAFYNIFQLFWNLSVKCFI